MEKSSSEREEQVQRSCGRKEADMSKELKKITSVSGAFGERKKKGSTRQQIIQDLIVHGKEFTFHLMCQEKPPEGLNAKITWSDLPSV